MFCLFLPVNICSSEVFCLFLPVNVCSSLHRVILVMVRWIPFSPSECNVCSRHGVTSVVFHLLTKYMQWCCGSSLCLNIMFLTLHNFSCILNPKCDVLTVYDLSCILNPKFNGFNNAQLELHFKPKM